MKTTFLTSKNFFTGGLGINTFYVEIDKTNKTEYYLGDPTHQFIIYVHLLYIQIILAWEV